jgi:hypothetical protein
MRFSDSNEFRAFIQSELDTNPDPDPTVVADKILADLSDEEAAAALRFTLRPYVASYATNHDRGIRRGQGVSGTAADTPASQVGRSRLRRAGVAWKEQVLATRLKTDRGRVFFRDCTADDLMAAAAIRYHHADANRVQGERLEALASAMRAGKWKTAAAVPERVLRETLTDEGVAA